MKRSLCRTLFVAAISTVFAAAATAQDGGPPFQINTFTTNHQVFPGVSADGTGGFVVAWESHTQDDGVGVGVIARSFDAAGAPRTGEVLANAVVAGPQEKAAVAALPDGGFFVAWASGFLPGEDVFIRRFAANGVPLGVDLPVNTTIFASQRAPSVDADASGNVVVVWESQNVIFQGNWTIFARRYNSAGVPLSGELQVSQATSGEQHEPVVAMDPLGNFVVTWEALGADGNGNGVLARRFDATGNPLGNQFLVNQNATGNQEKPWVDRDATGRFVVAWQSQSDPQYVRSGDIFVRRFDAAGNALGNEFRANTHTPSFQERPAVATAPDGRFMVVWQSGSQDGPSFGVFGQRYDASGGTAGGEFRVNTVTAGHQYQPAVTAQPGGGFVVAWAQQADAQTIFLDVWARIYPPAGGGNDLIFADGFETGDASRWSAAVTDNGDLAVTQAAALSGSSGLQAFVDDTASLYVQDNSPDNEPRYRARFAFHPGDFDPGEAAGAFRTRIFIAFEEGPSRRMVAIVLRRTAGQYAVMARVRQDDGSLRDTGFIPLTNAAHSLEFDWLKATGDNSLDGRFEMWIDGVSRSTLTGLDTIQHTMDMARMGALSVKPGASGTLRFDAFESRRLSYIGPAF